MKYIKIFSFQVLDKVKEGNEVYMLDRLKCEVYCVGTMSVADLADIITAKDEAERYEFWYIEEEDDES